MGTKYEFEVGGKAIKEAKARVFVVTMGRKPRLLHACTTLLISLYTAVAHRGCLGAVPAQMEDESVNTATILLLQCGVHKR